jgi:ABC-type cobalamin/Fe3+-siderophores transport system ATPase subunit
MQFLTTGIEKGSLPLSIVRIEVEKLFGKYTYTLLKKDNNLVDSSLVILYGDNGSGKTTILKLLFHLLSPAIQMGHRSFLAKTPFQKFSVVLTDGTSIVAIRTSGTLTGSFALQLTKNNDTFIENIEVKENQKYQEREGDDFYRNLLDLELSLFFLGDDRNLDSDIFANEEYIKQNSGLSNLELRTAILNSFEEKNTINREIILKKSIQRTEEWMREQALKGANQGAENVHIIYEEIISGILLSSGTTKDNSSNLSYKALIAELEYYETKSHDFYRFGLMSPLSTKKIANMLQSHPQGNHSIIPSILKPYLDGVEARFDALEDTYNILTIFEKTINNLFFTDKYIKLHIRDGLKILTKQGEELSSETLSSGEKQLLLLFCNTLTARDRATIFIIDEPEISLNIKWQRQLIRALLELTKGSQVQFILATHSIELLSQYKNHVIKLQTIGELSTVPEQLEERVETLEAEVALLKSQLKSVSSPTKPWWKKISGTFAENPAYDEAMQLGREYRESLNSDSVESRDI